MAITRTASYAVKMVIAMRTIVAGVLAAVCAAQAFAETGVGPIPRPMVDVPVPPIAQLGDDAFRFRAWQWKRRNWVLQLNGDARHASGDISFYGPHNEKVGWLTLSLSPYDYHQLMGKIDDALSKADQKPIHLAPNEVLISADGETYASERRKGGRSTWFVARYGFEDANETVRDLLLEAFQKEFICEYRPVLSPCAPPP